MEWQSQKEHLREGGGRGGDTPLPPSDLKALFTACLKIDSCNVRMAYYFLTSLTYLGTSVKKKKMPVVIFPRAQLGMQTCKLNA